ncbi:hypothetical protein KKH23_08855 [Patescibacteria group bacterium]|uniref:Uncharacterized protein n=1 Tax=viral metagenome TaxID=1070528 RepID=A0A6M3MAD9_9ZZZZ|nr:hypothetical protein [Patescibacteria group bacterium]
MSEFENQVLEVVKQQPEINPDGSIWYIRLGDRNWTKKDILDKWSTNEQLRKDLVKILLSLNIHKLTRGKTE